MDPTTGPTTYTHNPLYVRTLTPMLRTTCKGNIVLSQPQIQSYVSWLLMSSYDRIMVTSPQPSSYTWHVRSRRFSYGLRNFPGTKLQILLNSKWLIYWFFLFCMDCGNFPARGPQILFNSRWLIYWFFFCLVIIRKKRVGIM